MRLARIEKVPAPLDKPRGTALVIAEGIDDDGSTSQVTAFEQRPEHALGQRTGAFEHDGFELVGKDRMPEIGQLEIRELEYTGYRIDAEDGIVTRKQRDVLAPERNPDAFEIAHGARLEQEHGKHAAHEIERETLGEQPLEALLLG